MTFQGKIDKSAKYSSTISRLLGCPQPQMCPPVALNPVDHPFVRSSVRPFVRHRLFLQAGSTLCSLLLRDLVPSMTAGKGHEILTVQITFIFIDFRVLKRKTHPAFRVLKVFYFQTDFNLRFERKRDVRLTCKRV